MAEFEDKRDDLAVNRRELERRRAEKLLAHEAVRRAEQALDALGRRGGPRRRAEHARLTKKLEDARAWEDQLVAELKTLDANERVALDAFAQFSDPREHLAKCPDHLPILLLPLRLETRFKTGLPGSRSCGCVFIPMRASSIHSSPR
jgi:hypothetical protein